MTRSRRNGPNLVHHLLFQRRITTTVNFLTTLDAYEYECMNHSASHEPIHKSTIDPKSTYGGRGKRFLFLLDCHLVFNGGSLEVESGRSLKQKLTA
ncbi:hypothetical protein L484_018857 [Morus notabilis]|uniref:Uncharacterized protein n=1 Tax=Morus notabilis TaxID=981085 RepID=W9RXP6_9ROSA|nr:hypothetical protein L484_018857 [Morus notabilis]